MLNVHARAQQTHCRTNMNLGMTLTRVQAASVGEPCQMSRQRRLTRRRQHQACHGALQVSTEVIRITAGMLRAQAIAASCALASTRRGPCPTLQLTKRTNPHEFPCLAASVLPPASTPRLRANTESPVPRTVGPALAFFFLPRQIAHLGGQSAQGALNHQDDDNCFQGELEPRSNVRCSPALHCRPQWVAWSYASIEALANNDCRTCTSCWVCYFQVHRSRKLAHDPAGNDPELDPNRPAEPPTKAIDKPTPRHGKREGSDVKPAPPVERQGNQSRAKQSNNANDNGTSRHSYPRGSTTGAMDRCIYNRDSALTAYSF